MGATTDTLLEVILDRGMVFFFLSRALGIIEATWRDVMQAGKGIIGATACRRVDKGDLSLLDNRE